MINHTYVVSREEADYEPAIVSRDCNSRIPSTTRKREIMYRARVHSDDDLDSADFWYSSSGFPSRPDPLLPRGGGGGGSRGEDKRQGGSPPLRARAEMTSGLRVLHRIFKCSYGAYVLPPRGVSDCIAIFSRRNPRGRRGRPRRDDSRGRKRFRREVSPSASHAVLDSNAVAAFYGR